MILSKEVEISINRSNINHFSNLGYENLFQRKIICVPIEHLCDGSKVPILVKCDICGAEKILSYRGYKRSFNKLSIYCCSQKCAMFKNEQTCLEKYGVNHASKTNEFKHKLQKTSIERYGVENYSQTKECQDKVKKTNLKKYGAEHISKTEKFKEQAKKNNFKKYGVEYISQVPATRNKAKQTNLNKYGKENPFQNEEIKEKIKKTCLKKYGVEHPSQNPEIHYNQQKTGYKIKIHEQTGLYYQGTYEKHFLDFCFENNIPIKKAKTIKYYFKGVKKVYFLDFYLENINLIIEIKSTYTYKQNLSKNLAKQKACLEQGYNFIFIINKDYKEFKDFIKKNSYLH